MALCRYLITTLLLSLTLFGAKQDFRACQLKYQVSSLQLDTTKAFAVDNEYVLFYSEKKPPFKIIKRDPFLGLNLVHSDKAFKHIFKFYNNAPKHVASVLPSEVVEGRFTQEQVGLNQLAHFSTKSKKNALISGTCCGLLGISTGKGVIEKEYIRHFLASKKIVYSDIGIRVADEKGVRVVEVNPFFANSPFLLDDVILFMDGKKVQSAAQVSRDILFSKPGSVHYFKVQRASKEQKLKAKFVKRLSGGLVPDSFFDLFGLELDEFLVVKQDVPKYALKKGDKLLYVMDKPVKSLADIRHVLSIEKSSAHQVVKLLLRREGFDFFVHFDKPNNSQ